MPASSSPAERASALRPGHALTLLKGGEAFFPALVEAIDAARAEVLLETYIFAFDRSVIAVAEALERAGARGVQVRVAVDGVGTGDVPPEWQERWRVARVHWRIFNPARGWRLLMPRRWRRLHRKLCVVDAHVAFCGGINLLDDYYDPNHGELDQPRFDFSVRVTGPLVDDVHDTMTRLWARLDLMQRVRQHDLDAVVRAARKAARAGADLADRGLAAKGGPRGVPGPSAEAALVLRDNVRYRRRIESSYRLGIAQAQREILIANAYFIPGVQLQRALLRAAERGVRITLLLQGRYEYFMQHHASRAVYGVLLEAGIRIIEYAPSFLHAKVAVMDAPDGGLATVGSSNLDPLSLLLAREANVFVRDSAFTAELRAHLMDAIEHQGRQVDPEEHMRRPWSTRMLNWIAYGMMRLALFVTGKRY
ncbi:MAG: cardiolipin synthase ClsB [Proteobacteria bacterium]|nr:cardiolipin synthase ClsB [Pseudomonadota bacterium]